MGLVVFGKKDLSIIIDFPLDDLWDMKFFPQLQRQGLQPGSEAFGGDGQVAHEKAVKGQDRLIVENHNIQILNRDPAFLQTVGDGI